MAAVTKSNPYDVVYRALFKSAIPRKTTIVGLRTGEGDLVGNSLEKNMRYLLGELFPEDIEQLDTTLHALVRTNACAVLGSSEGGSLYDQPYHG